MLVRRKTKRLETAEELQIVKSLPFGFSLPSLKNCYILQVVEVKRNEKHRQENREFINFATLKRKGMLNSGNGQQK